MVTVHALTSDQPTLDLVPDGKYLNERFYRSAINNIILTSTGATRSLRLVLPEMEEIGFITQSVRVPVNTGSLIIMTVNVQDDRDDISIEDQSNKWNNKINNSYKDVAKDKNEYIEFSEKPHVSEDIKGLNKAVLIEGCETHSRTAEATIETDSKQVIIPIVQATIYGWYDNEMGNFVSMLSKNVDHIFDETYF
jgi:glyceraldehyde 3-phosphate dehydrogenase